MSLRRTLASVLGVILLAVLLTAPPAPLLVCRLTGQAMEPVAATPGTPGCCCTVRLTVATNGETRYALTNPGCCDLLQNPKPDEPPATVAVAGGLGMVAWLSAPPTWYVSAALVAVPGVMCTGQPPLRAPPRSQASPRAPPVFS